MTKYILPLALMALLFAECGNKKSDEHSHNSDGNHSNKDSAHEHKDGSVHEAHPDDEHAQEEFKVAADSSAVKTEKELSHSHEDGGH